MHLGMPFRNAVFACVGRSEEGSGRSCLYGATLSVARLHRKAALAVSRTIRRKGEPLFTMPPWEATGRCATR